jgi:hypothetical protein
MPWVQSERRAFMDLRCSYGIIQWKSSYHCKRIVEIYALYETMLPTLLSPDLPSCSNGCGRMFNNKKGTTMHMWSQIHPYGGEVGSLEMLSEPRSLLLTER